MTTMPIDEWMRLATLRPISTEDRRMGSDRNRSITPLLGIGGDAGCDDERGEHDGLRLDTGQQELTVGRPRPWWRWTPRTRTRTAART